MKVKCEGNIDITVKGRMFAVELWQEYGGSDEKDLIMIFGEAQAKGVIEAIKVVGKDMGWSL